MDCLDPIPDAVLLFAYALNRFYSPTCIAGSSALVKHLRDASYFSTPEEDLTPGMRRVTKRILRRDVDVFLQASPYKYVELCHPGASMSWSYLNRVITPLCGVGVMAWDTMHASSYGTLLGMCGPAINSVHNLALVKDGFVVGVRVQLILVDGHPLYRQTFPQFIVGHFDISVAKCYVRLDNDAELGRVVVSDEAREDIRNGEFEYTVLPYRTFRIHLKRLYKYARNGFSLKSLRLDHGCSSEYGEYIMGRLRHMYGPAMGYRALLGLGLTDPVARQLGVEMVAPYLAMSPRLCGHLHEWGIMRADAVRVLGKCRRGTFRNEMYGCVCHMNRRVAARYIRGWILRHVGAWRTESRRKRMVAARYIRGWILRQVGAWRTRMVAARYIRGWILRHVGAWRTASRRKRSLTMLRLVLVQFRESLSKCPRTEGP